MIRYCFSIVDREEIISVNGNIKVILVIGSASVMCVTVNDVLYFTNLVKINAEILSCHERVMNYQNPA